MSARISHHGTFDFIWISKKSPPSKNGSKPYLVKRTFRFSSNSDNFFGHNILGSVNLLVFHFREMSSSMKVVSEKPSYIQGYKIKNCRGQEMKFTQIDNDCQE